MKETYYIRGIWRKGEANIPPIRCTNKEIKNNSGKINIQAKPDCRIIVCMSQGGGEKSFKETMLICEGTRAVKERLL